MACLWAIRTTHKADEALRVLPGSEGHCQRGDARLPAEEEGNAKIGLSMPTCPGSIGSASHRMFCNLRAFRTSFRR